MGNVIFHIDMNMFFCSVAIIKNKALKGKPFVIGRSGTNKGVISTASYEARSLGIHSGMSLNDALRIKSDLIVVSVDYKDIKQYHNYFINLIEDYTKVIEIASIDEVYADMSEISKVRNAIEVAEEIQKRLLEEYNLPCSIGIAPTLFLAKMASDMKKPLGLVVIRKRDAYNMLKDLSVKDIFGIGKKTYPILIENNIKTIGDFFKEENKEKIIELTSENTYDYVISHVSGKSSNIVSANRYVKNKSISVENTYDSPLRTDTDILYELRNETKELITKLNKSGYLTKTIGITLRDSSFKTISRSRTVEYTNNFYDIFKVVSNLFYDNYDDTKVIRLCGVTFSNLKEKSEVLKEEYNLFTYLDYAEKDEALKEAIKKIEDKYGIDLISIGVKKAKE